jgi:phage tail sheath gpL-like
MSRITYAGEYEGTCSGTVTVSCGGQSASVEFGPEDTNDQVAERVAAAINAQESWPVEAWAEGSVLCQRFTEREGS